MIKEAITLVVTAFLVAVTPICLADAKSAKSPGDSTQIITAGTGLSACPIGCDAQQFVLLFPGAKVSGSHILVRDRGVEVMVRHSRIVTFFFYFNTNITNESSVSAQTSLLGAINKRINNDFGPKSDFKGRTDTGIGGDSSIDDVIMKYGKPDEYLKGTGPYGNGQEISLSYVNKGISFTFLNNRLSDIRVFSPPKAPPVLSASELRKKIVGEWQVNLHSAHQGMSFKEGFLTGTFGTVLTLNSDETALMTVPCDVDERANSKLRLNGQWKLTDKGYFSLHFMFEGKEMPFSSGELQLDDQSDEIDHLIIKQIDGKSVNFGRFNRSLLNCN